MEKRKHKNSVSRVHELKINNIDLLIDNQGKVS